MKTGLLGLLSILFTFSACNNKEKYALDYNLSEGDSFKQNMEMVTNLTQSFQGNEMKMNIRMGMSAVFSVEEIKDELLIMDMIYDKMNMDMDLGVAKISLNSDTENDIATLEDMSPMFKAFIGIPITVIMDTKGNIQSLSGIEKLQEAMIESIQPDMDEITKQQMMAMLHEQISEESFESMFKNSFSYFPEKEVSIGETWVKKSELSTQGMTMIAVLNITLKNIEGNTATLGCTGKISSPEGGIQQETNGMTAIVNISGTTEGTILIDMNTGITTKVDMVQNLKGNTSIGGMEIPQIIETKITLNN